MVFFGKVPLSTRDIVPADEALGWSVISIPFCSKDTSIHVLTKDNRVKHSK